MEIYTRGELYRGYKEINAGAAPKVEGKKPKPSKPNKKTQSEWSKTLPGRMIVLNTCFLPGAYIATAGTPPTEGR